MNRSDVEERIRKIAVKIFDVKLDDVRRETTFAELGADSLHQVELAIAVEESFGLEISESVVRQFVSVQTVIDYVHQHADLK
ncbi:MAG: acyl carrier protein [Nitrospirae bacterium]|nr:acyl carrier protein [Nitrospirota bacterium]